MYVWEGKSFAEVADLPRRRDPTRYAIGALISCGEPRGQVLLWFHRRAELAAFLWRMEPQRWGLKGPALIQYKDASADLFTRVDMLGLEPELREQLNELAQPQFHVDWWGHLRELMTSEGQLAQELRVAFQGNAGPLGDQQVAAFADYLQQRFPVAG